ncbi:uncharacterized protein LOC128892006 [Hylaeus anthracinus]|uniref:uncharacterized protein LOC128892006 n=1 Tax=Hylaeus anthracinus TaxID=313031 RepID=UPI0023B98CAE|nr:uncharacterized protein LOC128892006 [Hylaeus anthracinus]
MQKPYNSVETVPERKYNNVDQNTKNILRNNEDKVNFKRTQTTDPDPPPQTPTQSTSGKKQKQGKQKPAAQTTSSSSISQKPDNAVKRCFRWCTQCCRKRDRKRVEEVSSKLWESLKAQREKCRSKKRRKGVPSEQSSASTAEYSGSREIKGKKSKRDSDKADKFDDSRRSRKKRKKHASEASVVDTPTINDEKLVASHALGKDFDFTKSCCYLCATNAMALAAAMSGRVDKLNMSIQASIHFEEKATSVKNDGLPMRVRTVQSSVKVKTRDMSTLYPEEKKPKKPKAKLKLKNLNIFPKVKVPIQPKVRHVACGTDKTMRSNNVTPQCRAGRGTHCMRGDK